MFDQLSAEIPASLIKGFPTTTTTRTRTTTTKQNVDPAVHFVYSRVKKPKTKNGTVHMAKVSHDFKFKKLKSICFVLFFCS
jgi:hypothetical protein